MIAYEQLQFQDERPIALEAERLGYKLIRKDKARRTRQKSKPQEDEEREMMRGRRSRGYSNGVEGG